ncbi:MAG: hypothetical protein ACI8YQ_004475, partial [Polaribacter sp.]
VLKKGQSAFSGLAFFVLEERLDIYEYHKYEYHKQQTAIASTTY